MNGDLKLTFIQLSLQQYFDEVITAMRITIRQKKVGVTDSLLNSLASKVVQSSTGAQGQLFFDESGRFIDMGVSKSHALGGLKATSAAFAGKKAKARGAKKIYSPIAYGKMNHLITQLLYGFSEETIATLKSQMQIQN